jgi:DNA repair exonuclease SbcCD ATPase subunit
VVAEETQKKIEYQISNLVSLALSSVFPDPYEFKLRFVMRRNKTEADLLFIKRGNEGKPIDVSGGGALDVASFALRIAVWSIKPTNNVIIQDEPFHFLSRNLQAKCSQMIKMINQKKISGKRLQFIIVSHIPEITEAADCVFNITYENGISIVKKITN